MIPALPDRQLLMNACRVEGERQGLLPATIEKDFYLTRLIWALAAELGEALLLKGGTCLSKCDLGYHRMSEDADFTLPLEGSTRYKGTNARQMNRVRDALRAIAPSVGVAVESPDGERHDRASHVLWTLMYRSELAYGQSAIIVEVSLRTVLLPPRRVSLHQLLHGPVVPNYAAAYCWALAAEEVRAEKVRAAYTRAEPEIRDFYDLYLLANAGVDFGSPAFKALVDAKLAEAGAAPLSEQPGRFGLSARQESALEAAVPRRLAPMLRRTDPPFDLGAVLRFFDALWAKDKA